MRVQSHWGRFLVLLWVNWGILVWQLRREFVLFHIYLPVCHVRRASFLDTPQVPKQITNCTLPLLLPPSCDPLAILGSMIQHDTSHPFRSKVYEDQNYIVHLVGIIPPAMPAGDPVSYGTPQHWGASVVDETGIRWDQLSRPFEQFP